jgi:hypothetical protein
MVLSSDLPWKMVQEQWNSVGKWPSFRQFLVVSDWKSVAFLLNLQLDCERTVVGQRGNAKMVPPHIPTMSSQCPHIPTMSSQWPR